MPAALLSILTPCIFLLLVYFCPMQQCCGKHQCMSCTLPLATLNRTYSLRSVITVKFIGSGLLLNQIVHLNCNVFSMIFIPCDEACCATGHRRAAAVARQAIAELQLLRDRPLPSCSCFCNTLHRLNNTSGSFINFFGGITSSVN